MSQPPRTARQRRAARRPGRKLLGLDLGARRVGIAISDDTGQIATPLRVIDLRTASLADIARIAEEEHVAGIIVGLPVNMSGEEGFQAREVRRQCDALARHTTLPIVLWDERLTSAIAEEIIAERRRGRRRPANVDAIAAAIMLQSFLDSHPMSITWPECG